MKTENEYILLSNNDNHLTRIEKCKKDNIT